MTLRTVNSYINAFIKLFIIDETETWSPKLRSKSIIRSTNTRHFIDPAIATFILNANPEDLINDLNTFGLMFENLVMRDLKIYAQSLDGKIYKYRDSSGLEVDAVIHLNSEEWGLIEIKLGGESSIDEAANNLKLLVEKVSLDKMNQPSFLAVITATTKFAYTRNDGIHVIPIACLRP